MAARRPRLRRWWVPRRRFLDAQGEQVTDTWLNIPLLPRRMLTTGSPDQGVTRTTMSGGRPLPVGCIALLAVLLLVPLLWSISRDVGTGPWVRSIPDYLIALGALASLTVMSWNRTHRPSPVRFVLPAVLVLVALVWESFRDVGIGQVVRSIPDAFVILGALSILTVLAVQRAHRPE
jgi:hypothetical protein